MPAVTRNALLSHSASGLSMRPRLLAVLFLALPLLGLDAQEATGPWLHFAAGIAGQRDGDRDLGSAGVTADLGVAWVLSPSLRARLSATIFSLPIGQRCTCDPGGPPLGVQGAYGALVAVQSVPRARPLYWLGGASYRRGGFRAWNEHQTAGFLAGLGWAFGARRQGAVEARYEYFFSPLGATRALLPLIVTWRF